LPSGTEGFNHAYGYVSSFSASPLDHATASVSYECRIRYETATGLSAWSDAVSHQIPGDPAGASAATPQITVTNNSITAKWTGVNADQALLTIVPEGADVDNEFIIASNDGLTPIESYGSPDANGDISITISNLKPGTAYGYVAQLETVSPSVTATVADGNATTTGTKPIPIPAAPGSVTATVDPKDDTKVNVHWLNTPGNETGYLLERSADDGTSWSVLKALGADETCYTDDSIPFDQYGNVTLIYRILAQAAQKRSVPAVGAPLVDREVAVTSVTVQRNTQDPVEGAHHDAFGYYFEDNVIVRGTNLQNVLIRQQIDSTTSLWSVNGNPIPPEIVGKFAGSADPVVVNTHHKFPWPTDSDWQLQPVQNLADGNRIGRHYDTQAGEVPTFTSRTTSGYERVGLLCSRTLNFEITLFDVAHQDKPLFTWDGGYTWTNANARWSTSATPPPPFPCVVSNDVGHGAFVGVYHLDGVPWLP
jgi:hypothetical protein